MSTPKSVVKEFIEAHNRHDVEGMLRQLADDSRMIDPAAPIPLTSKADVRKLYELIFKALPDIRFEVTTIIAEGADVFAAFRTTGRGVGEFMGKDISGKAIDVYESVFMHVENGRITSTVFYSDSATLSKQLGYVTALSSGST
jgi:steroid delta-isomerase-like uncharacterized protein